MIFKRSIKLNLTASSSWTQNFEQIIVQYSERKAEEKKNSDKKP